MSQAAKKGAVTSASSSAQSKQNSYPMSTREQRKKFEVDSEYVKHNLEYLRRLPQIIKCGQALARMREYEGCWREKHAKWDDLCRTLRVGDVRLDEATSVKLMKLAQSADILELAQSIAQLPRAPRVPPPVIDGTSGVFAKLLASLTDEPLPALDDEVPPEEVTAIEKAKAFLEENYCGEGWFPTQSILDAGKKAGHAEGTLKKAKRKLRGQTRKEKNFGGKCSWFLPASWPLTPEEVKLLGTATDSEIAERTGRTLKTIFNRRTSLGITAYGKTKREVDEYYGGNAPRYLAE